MSTRPIPLRTPTRFTDYAEHVGHHHVLGAGLFYMFGKMVGNTRQGWVLWVVSAISL